MSRVWYATFWIGLGALAALYVVNVEAVIEWVSGLIPFGEPVEEASDLMTDAVLFTCTVAAAVFVYAMLTLTGMRLSNAGLGFMWLGPMFVWLAASALIILWAPWLLAAGDSRIGPSVNLPPLPFESIALLAVFVGFLTGFGSADPFRRRAADVVAAWVVAWAAGLYATLTVGLDDATRAIPVGFIRRPMAAVAEALSAPFTAWHSPAVANNYGWALIVVFASALVYLLLRGGYRTEAV